jgi:hypothetical protein
MGLRLFWRALDQEDRREDQKPAGDWSEPNISEEVAQQHKYRYQAEAKPPRDAAQHFAHTHGFVSGW